MSYCPWTSDGRHVHIGGSTECNVCEANKRLCTCHIDNGECEVHGKLDKGELAKGRKVRVPFRRVL